MRKYNGVNALWMSFYSGDFYCDVVDEWKGSGLLYLLVLTVSYVIIPVFPIIGLFNGYVEHVIMPVVDEFPTITVENGELSMDRNEPLVLRDRANGFVLCTIAPMTEPPPVPGAQDGAMVISHNQILAYNSISGAIHIFELPESLNLELNRSMMRSAVFMVKYLGPIVLLGLYTSTLFFLNCCFCTVFGVFSVAIGRLFQAQFSLASCVRVAAVAMTPAYLISCPLTIAPWLSRMPSLSLRSPLSPLSSGPFGTLDWIGPIAMIVLISAAFLFFALFCCAKGRREVTQTAS